MVPVPVPVDLAPEDAGAEEPDAGDAEPAREDQNAPLDDFRLGELKRKKNFEEKLEAIELMMKQTPKKQLRYEAEYKLVKEKCAKARTLKEVNFAEDELHDLETDFYR